MARIELRNTTIRLKDGFSGTAAIDDTPAAAMTALEIDTIANLTDAVTLVPVGARFTIAGSATIHTITAANGNAVQTVTLTSATGGTFTLTVGTNTTTAIAYDALAAAVQSALAALASVGTGNVTVTGNAGGPYTVEFKGTKANTPFVAMTASGTSLVGAGASVAVAVVQAGGTTWELTFSPGIPATAVPSDDAVITFLPQQLEIKIGDGNLTYTERNNYEYRLDRGDLDTVVEGDQAPMEVKIDGVFESITTGTSEDISVMDALKGIGGAAGWFSSASDPCEPYAVDVEVVHTPPCGSKQTETVLFPDFRSETREINYKDATISTTGKCNATEPTVTRA